MKQLLDELDSTESSDTFWRFVTPLLTSGATLECGVLAPGLLRSTNIVDSAYLDLNTANLRRGSPLAGQVCYRPQARGRSGTSAQSGYEVRSSSVEKAGRLSVPAHLPITMSASLWMWLARQVRKMKIDKTLIHS